MNTVVLAVENVSMLGLAYLVGFPVAWVAEKVGNVINTVSVRSGKWQEFNRAYDEMYGSPWKKMNLPWN
jgi:hypothetical protein